MFEKILQSEQVCEICRSGRCWAVPLRDEILTEWAKEGDEIQKTAQYFCVRRYRINDWKLQCVLQSDRAVPLQCICPLSYEENPKHPLSVLHKDWVACIIIIVCGFLVQAQRLEHRYSLLQVIPSRVILIH